MHIHLNCYEFHTDADNNRPGGYCALRNLLLRHNTNALMLG